MLYHAFGVREGYDYVGTQYQDGCIRFVLSIRPDWIQCPGCGSRDIARKGRRFRELQTVPIGLKPVFLVTEVPQCHAACGKRFEVTPPLAPAYAHYTHRLEAFVNDLRGLMAVSDLAALTGLSWDTVKDIIKKALEKGCGHPRLKDLRSLSMDEIYLGRQKKFYTLVIDLESGRIVYVAKGQGAAALSKFWRALRLSKARIAAVTMDMSAACWAAVAENLPEAAVVFDRFHLVKLVNEKLDDLRRAMVREATGLMKKAVKGIRYLLLTRRENVGPDQLPRREEALKTNEPLNIGYLLKEALGLLWSQRSRQDMADFLKEWCPTNLQSTGY